MSAFRIPSPQDLSQVGRNAIQALKEYVDKQLVVAAPAGALEAFAGSTAPEGFLLCQGQAVSRVTYASLFTSIGTTWGVGDGSTTFNLPDLRGRTLIGAGTGSGLSARSLAATGGAETHLLTSGESGLVGHNHTQNAHNHTQDAHSHAVPGGYAGYVVATSGFTLWDLAPRSGGAAYAYQTYGGMPNATATNQAATATNNAVAAANAASAHNNMQPFAVINWIIKT